MNGDRDHQRKEPLPLAVSRSAHEPPAGDQVEPRLRAFGDEPSVSEESGLVVPSDLRAAHQSRGSAPIIAIAAFIVFCLCGAGYTAWTFGGADSKPSTPETATAPPAQTATPMKPQSPPAVAQPTVATTPPNTPAPVVDQAAEQARQQAAAAEARRVEQAKRDKAKREQAKREQAQREQALREREQAQKEQAQREQEQAEKARLAAIRRHEDKVRAERQRKEAAARRAQQARTQQEQAVQEQLDQAAATPPQPPQPPSTPPVRRMQNAKLTPASPPGDAPPLDATDLPPRAPGTANDAENQ